MQRMEPQGTPRVQRAGEEEPGDKLSSSGEQRKETVTREQRANVNSFPSADL